MLKDHAELIKSRIDIAEYIGRWVNLRKSGGYYVGLSPFKPERTPSFTVTPRLGIFKCFATGKSGDVITFHQEMTGHTFWEDIFALSQEAGVPLPETTGSRPSDETIVAAANKRAQELFTASLKASPAAIQFLQSRGVTGASAKAFGIGYAPAGRMLIEHSGLPVSELEMASLARVTSDRDFFQDRITFPIQSPYGAIIGFAGRTLGTAKPKFMNTASTALYNKSEALFGAHQALEHARRQDLVFVVEGYLDVVILWQHDIKNVVAVCGTAFTADHAKALKQLTKNVVFCYDADESGANAAIKSIPVALNAGMAPYVLTMPSGFDPDEFVLNHGKDGFELLADEKQNGIDFIAKSLMSNPQWSNAGAAKIIVEDAVESLSSIKDNDVRRWSIKALAGTVGMDAESLLRLDAKIQYRKNNPRNYDLVLPVGAPALPDEELVLLTLADQHEMLFMWLAGHFDETIFTNALCRDVFRQMVVYHTTIPSQRPAEVPWIDMPFTDAEKYRTAPEPFKLARQIVYRLVENNLLGRQTAVTQQLYQCTDPDLRAKLMTRLSMLQNGLKNLHQSTPETLWPEPQSK